VTPPPAAAAAPAPTVRPRRPARHGGPAGKPTRGAPPQRRVSGPAKPAARTPAKRAVTGKGSTNRSSTRSPTNRSPTRTRGYARGGAIALPAPYALPGGSLIAGALGALEGVSHSRMLDRLIRGRAWIGVVAFALIGIVAMQLWVVKLGVGIGRALEHAESLQRENSTLAIEDSSLSSGERIEQLAQARGMVVVRPGALRFDTLRGALDTRLAAAALAKPLQTQTSGLSGSDTAGVAAGAGAGATGSASGEAGASPAAGGEATSAASDAAQTPSSETSAAGSAEAASAAGTTAAGTTGATSEAGAAGATSESGAAGAGTGSSAPAASAVAPTSTPPAGTPSATATGGSAEATASPTAGSGGGTQSPAG
jgi:cell division protein FtsL